MKYFYAVVHCNSAKTAKKVYKEYNGYELELTNIKLNLSFVADDLKFPQDVREECEEVPPGYDFNPSKVSRALNHSTVKLTWDQTDPKRTATLQNNYKAILKAKADESDDDLYAYQGLIASSSGEDQSDADSQDSEKKAKEQARIEEMRRKLLGGLSKDDRQKGHKNQSDDEELEVNFGIGFGEDLGKKFIEKKAEKKEKE